MACKQFEIARETTINFILNKKTFSLDELQKNILKLGGLLIVSSCQTLDAYLRFYEQKHLIIYSPKTKSYSVL